MKKSHESNNKIILLAASVIPFALLFFAVANLCASEVMINALNARRNLFSGQNHHLTYRLSSNDFFQGKLFWRLHFESRTLLRGERSIMLQGEDITTGIELNLPEMNDAAALPVELELWLIPDRSDRSVARANNRIWIFPQNPFQYRKEEFRRKHIHLFDPQEHTAKIFNDVGIPYTPVYRLNALDEVQDALIIIGESTSLTVNRGLADRMMELASKGNKVLCLSMNPGELKNFPVNAIGKPFASAVHFQKEKIIRQIDKRIDSSAWSEPGRIAVCGIRLNSRRNQINGEFVCNGQGWPWLELDFENTGGKLIFCGFRMFEHWESGPAPRYLMDGILQYIFEKSNFRISQ